MGVGSSTGDLQASVLSPTPGRPSHHRRHHPYHCHWLRHGGSVGARPPPQTTVGDAGQARGPAQKGWATAPPRSPRTDAPMGSVHTACPSPRRALFWLQSTPHPIHQVTFQNPGPLWEVPSRIQEGTPIRLLNAYAELRAGLARGGDPSPWPKEAPAFQRLGPGPVLQEDQQRGSKGPGEPRPQPPCPFCPPLPRRTPPGQPELKLETSATRAHVHSAQRGQGRCPVTHGSAPTRRGRADVSRFPERWRKRASGRPLGGP